MLQTDQRQLGKDACIVPIPGAKTLRQAQENAGAIGWQLSAEEHARISEAARPRLR
jgi:aryl-alcohol dehydrogenase-like predicted oxidoreductase